MSYIFYGILAGGLGLFIYRILIMGNRLPKINISVPPIKKINMPEKMVPQAAFSQEPSKASKVLAEIVTPEQINKELHIVTEQGITLGRKSTEMTAELEEEYITVLSTQFGFPYLQLANYEISKDAINIIPADIARKENVMPVDKIGTILTIVAADPLDKKMIETIKHISRCDVEIFVSRASEIQAAINKYYPDYLADLARKTQTAQKSQEKPKILHLVQNESAETKEEIDLMFEEMLRSLQANPADGTKINPPAEREIN